MRIIDTQNTKKWDSLEITHLYTMIKLILMASIIVLFLLFDHVQGEMIHNCTDYDFKKEYYLDKKQSDTEPMEAYGIVIREKV